MTVIDIDETTDVGRDILRRVSSNPVAGTVRDFEILVDDDDDEDLDDFPHFSAEELERTRAEILAGNPEGEKRILKIPRDENGNPIGYTWEETREMMYSIISRRWR